MLALSRLNAIVDVEIAGRAGWAPADLAAAYVNGGVRFLQIRAKSLSGAAFLELSTRVCEIAHRAGAIVVVNDRADIARLSGADGVHLGQDDLDPAAARAIVGHDAIVGMSTHTTAQIDGALGAPVTYIAVGPVFGTSTKATGYAPVGLERVREAADEVRVKSEKVRLKPDATYDRRADSTRSVGIVAIGGITLDSAVHVIEAGATSVAVITDLLATGDPEARVQAYLARLGERGKV